MNPRHFRKKTSSFWRIWPIIPICDEIHHVACMDGIWLTRKCVILIACTDDYVIGCHLARTENSKDWGCLMQRIAAPDVLVYDGGGGIEKARRGLVRLCNEGTLFTYLADDLVADGPVPSTSNAIGNLNGRIRRMLGFNRGMSIDHGVKAVFWFCYMKSEAPVAFAEMTRKFPDDETVREWRRRAAEGKSDDTGTPARWGEGLAWSELHHQTPYPYALD